MSVNNSAEIRQVDVNGEAVEALIDAFSDGQNVIGVVRSKLHSQFQIGESAEMVEKNAT